MAAARRDARCRSLQTPIDALWGAIWVPAAVVWEPICVAIVGLAPSATFPSLGGARAATPWDFRRQGARRLKSVVNVRGACLTSVLWAARVGASHVVPDAGGKRPVGLRGLRFGVRACSQPTAVVLSTQCRACTAARTTTVYVMTKR